MWIAIKLSFSKRAFEAVAILNRASNWSPDHTRHFRERLPSSAKHTFDLKMASILSLPDDCLHNIVSFIEDPSSFMSISLTCQRFFDVTKNSRSVLHTNLLRVKAEYLIKCGLRYSAKRNETKRNKMKNKKIRYRNITQA